ncbi:MAG: baseplate J/gp47 family protein [Bacteroidales bacterium]|nr:baseplate J/gp47 family protein [Bacteroidales bacterium]
MLDTSVFNGLPEVSILKDQNITLEGIQAGMVADFEARKEEITGEKCTLVPTDDRRLILDAIGGELYLLAQIMDIAFKQNFLPYMYGSSLKNWAANIGCFNEDGTLIDGKEAASCTLLFTLSEEQENDVTIPEGTRATAGDDVFFATIEDIVIAAGDTTGTVTAACTEKGTKGNGYVAGKLTTIADPIAFVESVTNTTTTAGGHDEYTNIEYREMILNRPSTYSVAGPAAAYETMAKEYSSRIVDARCITNNQALVQIYIMLADAALPSAAYCQAIEDFITAQKKNPGTDSIEVLAPTVVNYNLTATYYISRDNEDAEDAIKATVESAATTFTKNTASKIGKAINPNNLVSYAMAAGAKRITVTSPVYTAIDPDEIGICSNINLTYGGLEDE